MSVEQRPSITTLLTTTKPPLLGVVGSFSTMHGHLVLDSFSYPIHIVLHLLDNSTLSL